MGQVGVVVIGRNEGERLKRCLASVVGRARVVYVDSGSDDGSVDLATRMKIEVVQLDTSIAFSAARARNEGFARMMSLEPDVPFVQFVDGDCEFSSGWLECAERTLAAREDTAVACGRLRERFPDASIYNRLCDMEWDAPVGEVEATGGIFCVRAAAFRAVGGLNAAITAGEEPELCARLRRAGWKVVRLPDEMALHDANMMSLKQWWCRQVRSGYGAADVDSRFAVADQKPFARQRRSARMWVIGWMCAVIIGAVAGGILRREWGAAAGGGLAASTMPLQMLRLGLRNRIRAGSMRSAMAYGFFTMIGKFAQLIGEWRWQRDRSAGRNARLIEYRGVGPGQRGGAAATH